jgi:hypothetical protein
MGACSILCVSRSGRGPSNTSPACIGSHWRSSYLCASYCVCHTSAAKPPGRCCHPVLDVRPPPPPPLSEDRPWYCTFPRCRSRQIHGRGTEAIKLHSHQCWLTSTMGEESTMQSLRARDATPHNIRQSITQCRTSCFQTSARSLQQAFRDRTFWRRSVCAA